ncbi:MAG: hypothetical protein IKO73_07115 [Bacteroidaceae bacterium]|nr:hypothetical protein [Bacteroidaceae bacterium]
MKKLYISPELLIVQLSSRTTILQASDPDVGIDGSESVDADLVETRESVITGKSVWDEEW